MHLSAELVEECRAAEQDEQLQHAPGTALQQHRGDVAGDGRRGERRVHLEVDAHGQHGGLHHEAEEHQHDGGRDSRGGKLHQRRANLGQLEGAGFGPDQGEPKEQEARANRVEQEVFEGFEPGGLGFLMGDCRPQRPRTHQLPEGEEAEDVLRLGHAEEPGDHHGERREETSLRMTVRKIGGGVQHVECAHTRDQHCEAEGEKIVARCFEDDAAERCDQHGNGKATGPGHRHAANQEHRHGAGHRYACTQGPVRHEAGQRQALQRAAHRRKIANVAYEAQLIARREAAEDNRRREHAHGREHRGGSLADACLAFIGVVEEEADNAGVVDHPDDAAEQHERGDAA